MTPQQYQYYSFTEQNRKRAMYRQLLTQQILSWLRAAIHDGKDPRIDPTLAKYWILISENDQRALIQEMQDINLTFEDGTVPQSM